MLLPCPEALNKERPNDALLVAIPGPEVDGDNQSREATNQMDHLFFCPTIVIVQDDIEIGWRR